MHEYITLDDNTAIAYSDMKADGTVKVYIEKPIEGGFHHVTCYLPKFEWCDNDGFSDDDIAKFQKIIENYALK